MQSTLCSGPKKRPEIWVQEEIRALVSLRKEKNLLFNSSKFNKHLWEDISLKMRKKGFDRSHTMCLNKWSNLLADFRKAKLNNQYGNRNGSAKMNYYKDIEEILSERSTNGPGRNNMASCNNAGGSGGGGSKFDSFMQFADKGEQSNTYDGRVMTVKLGDCTKRIGIVGTADALKEAIKSAFRLRTKRAFWLEDEDSVIRTLDRDMPLLNYTLNVDEGRVLHT